MATFTTFNSLPEAIAEKVHNFASDALTLAFCATANAPVVANSVLADLTTVATTYAGTLTLTVSSSGQTGGTYILVVADKTVTASGGAVGPFQYIVVYNDTATNNELIGFYDYGSALTLNDGDSLTLDFSAVNGIIQVS